MKSRMTLLLGSIAIALTLLLAFFSLLPEHALAAPFDPSTRTEGLTITYWHHNTGEREVFLNELVAEFNETMPYEFTVVAEYAGSYNDIHIKIIDLLQNGGDLPHVVVAYSNSFADFARYGKVRFLDDYIQDSVYGISDPEDFYPGVLETYQLPDYGDQTAGLQWGRSIEVMYYNQDLLESHSLAIPQTWEDFINACKTISSEDVLGTMVGFDPSRFANWLWSHGGEFFSDDYETVRFAEQPGIDSLLLFQDLIQEGYASTISEAYEDQILFGQGKVGFTFGTSTGIPYYRIEMENGVNQEWGVARTPAVPGYEVVDSYGAGQGILTHSPEEDLASWLFIRWLAEREQTARWAAKTGYFPVRISASTHPSMIEKLAIDVQYAQAFDLQELAKPEPGLRGYNSVRNALYAAMESTLANNAEVTSTLQTAADQARELINFTGESALITPEEGGTVVFTNTLGVETTIVIAPESVTEPVTVTLMIVEDLPLTTLGLAILPDTQLNEPAQLTIKYLDDHVAGLDESQLALLVYDWETRSWKDSDPCGGYLRDMEKNLLTAFVCHFSDYGIFDYSNQIFLPIVLRN